MIVGTRGWTSFENTERGKAIAMFLTVKARSANGLVTSDLCIRRGGLVRRKP